MMNRRVIKKQIFSLLERQSWSEIEVGILRYQPQESLHALFSALCSSNALCKWHAVSAFGLVVPKMADVDIESARIVMRRFLWSLNDESGGIGWGVPEAMADVMAESDILFDEYGKLLLSYMREDGPEIFQDGNYLELPALQQGLLWGVGRLLATRNKSMLAMDVSADLQKYLYSSDRIVRALSGWCLGMCGIDRNIQQIKALTADHFLFDFYWEKRLTEISVASLSTQAVNVLSRKEMR